MMHTAIVILNWNGKHHLQRFLPNVIKHTPDWVDIYVADNVHYNAEGYGLYADFFREALKAELDQY